jgi:hypothetical protein
MKMIEFDNKKQFPCCEDMSACHRKDMLEYAGVLMESDREIEALGVLKLLVLWIEGHHKIVTNKKTL